jgi:colicin import membrane protein
VSLLQEHFGSVFWSVALHAAVIAALALGADFRKPPPPVEMLAIEAVVVDETMLARADQQAEAERQRQAEVQRQQAEAERQRQAEAERQRQAEVERQRQEAQAAEQREAELAEQQRQAQLERQRDEAEAERQRQAEVERQRQEAEAERQRQADLERQREEAERQRQADLERERQEAEAERQRLAEEERRRREAEAERQRQAQLDAELQREAERLAAVRGGALDEYRTLLRNRIEQNWIRPPSARAGINCTVHVTQIPSGEVINARVAACNGDEAVVRSIEAAVLRASPLPLPSVPSLFERNLVIDFVPEE